MNPKHGCHNKERKHGYWADNSGADDRSPSLHAIYIVDIMSKECQYSKQVTDDPRCTDCSKKHKEK